MISLLGHGAGSRDIALIVASVALSIALATFAGTGLVTPRMVLAFQPLLPWASFSVTDLLAPLAGICVALAFAVVAARRAIAGLGPEIVFRS